MHDRCSILPWTFPMVDGDSLGMSDAHPFNSHGNLLVTIGAYLASSTNMVLQEPAVGEFTSH